MEKSFDPVNKSPEEFYESFLANYGNCRDFGFPSEDHVRNIISLNSRTPIHTFYTGGIKKGTVMDFCANVEIKPYSSMFRYSRTKSEYQGSVWICSSRSIDLRAAKKDLEKMTGIELKEVRIKRGNKHESN
jgi:hypothetical protein